jgi:carboxyl-terminal processing protease
MIFKIVRDKIDTPSVPNFYMIRPSTGYIKLSNFTQTSADDLDNAIVKLKARGMQRMILDLRGNPGGLLEQAVKIADRFVDDGKLVVYTRGRVSGSDQEYPASKVGDENTMPVVVLINRGSASASEIVAGALQDHDRALIVGETSFGKGLVQSVYRLSNQAGLALTTAKYYTPSGRLIQRDYSSLEDYFFDFDEEGEGSEKAPTATSTEGDLYHTDTGRVVTGGGGIKPDVEVKSEEIPKLVLDLARNNFFFKFAVRFAPTLEQIPKERTNDQDALDLLLHTFTPDDRSIEAFRKFLAEKKFEFDETEFRGKGQIRTLLKAELLETVGGLALKDRVMAESDPQVLKAIDLIPQARDLAQLSRTTAQESVAR